MKLFNPIKSFELKSEKSFLQLILNHILAIIFPLTGLLVIFLAGQPIGAMPLLIFFPIIAVCAYVGGFTAGTLSAVISAIVVNYFSLPQGRFILNITPVNAFQFLILLTEGVFLSFIIEQGNRQEKIRSYKIREQKLQKELTELHEENENYKKEILLRDEFLSIASHELKTPLTSMLLQTQTALHNIRNVSVARFSFENLLKMLESVENQTKRLSKMINDLLAVSVITIGNLSLEYENIDLDILVKGVLIDFQARIEKEKYSIAYIADEKVTGYWDKIRIEQAVSNFISNAIKYGDHKPIEIKIKKNSRFAEFTIKDNGIGITKQKQKRIFELFQRAVSPDEYKGLGVGLYITQKIVLAHGGNVDVSSSPSRGSTFTMKLPLEIHRK